MVDDEDFDWLTQWKWYALRKTRTFYARRAFWVNGKGAMHERMHTVITGYAITDHVDGNGLNNQRVNLRDTTPCLNSLNAAKRLTTTRSQFKGLSWEKSKWRVRVQSDNRGDRPRRTHVGAFLAEEDAARAYDDAVRERYGPYGAYNFPRPGERSALTGLIIPELVLP
jgi:hypothetical protein